jgi:DNA-binding response OmpR family regulator
MTAATYPHHPYKGPQGIIFETLCQLGQATTTQLMDALWPVTKPDSASTALRVHIHRLRSQMALAGEQFEIVSERVTNSYKIVRKVAP